MSAIDYKLTKEKIKSCVTDAARVLSHFVTIDAQHKALCPFHEDTKPSLSVKGPNWKCFVCGKGGDSIAFVQEWFGCSYGEALEKTCDAAGIEPVALKTQAVPQVAIAPLSDSFDKRLAKVHEWPLTLFIRAFVKGTLPQHGSKVLIDVLPIGYKEGEHLQFIKDFYWLTQDRKGDYDALLLAEEFLRREASGKAGVSASRAA